MINLLYVDDERTNLLVLKHSLDDAFNVITAESASEGLDILNSNKEIQAVITDMRMPRMNGVEFVREARGQCPETPFFILTGYDLDDEIEDALKSKLIHRTFKKPFDANEISSSIQQVVELV